VVLTCLVSLITHPQIVERVSHRLLVAAVADPSERVRVTVLGALQSTDALDEFLAQVGSSVVLWISEPMLNP
jgi:hypothetical protein